MGVSLNFNDCFVLKRDSRCIKIRDLRPLRIFYNSALDEMKYFPTIAGQFHFLHIILLFTLCYLPSMPFIYRQETNTITY